MNPKLLDNLELISTSKGGIKKIRQLILELAVRGKLVPQDPNDEPASELLKKIQSEKQKLIAEGKLKKEKPLYSIADTEKSFDLPKGWERSHFGDVSINRDGERIPVSSEVRSNKKKTYDYYGASGVIDKIDGYLFDKPLLLIGEDGANLISRSTPIAFIAQGKYWVNNHAHVIDAINFDLLCYLELHINAISLEPYITGTAQPKMNQAKMNSIPINIPPIAEQRRIILKVDELMKSCDQLENQQNISESSQKILITTFLDSLSNSKSFKEFSKNWEQIEQNFETLFTTEDSIDELKKTILQLAVMGKLVPQDSKDQPANELLKNIQAEKQKLIAKGKIKKEKPLPLVDDSEKPFKLPNGWEWVRMKHVLNKITDGTHQSPPNIANGKYKYVTAKNIKPWGLDLTGITYVTAEVHNEIYGRCNPETGDVLYIKDGATTGIAAINTLTEPFSMLSSVALLKPSSGIYNVYLLNALKSPVFYNQTRADMSGVAITRVTLAKLDNAIFPLPPLAEQHRIVAKVDELMSLCDTLKSKITESQNIQNLMSVNF